MYQAEFEQYMREYAETIKRDTSVALPATINSYDPKTQTAEVSIMLKHRNAMNEEEEIAPLFNVPVWFDRSDSFYRHIPVEQGLYGHIVCFDKSIDMYKFYGQKILPKYKAKHSINDAIFVPGWYPLNKVIENLDNSLMIVASTTDNKTQITIDKNNNIITKNSNCSAAINSDGSYLLKNSNCSVTMDRDGSYLIKNKGGGNVSIDPNGVMTIKAKSITINSPQMKIGG